VEQGQGLCPWTPLGTRPPAPRYTQAGIQGSCGMGVHGGIQRQIGTFARSRYLHHGQGIAEPRAISAIMVPGALQGLLPKGVQAAAQTTRHLSEGVTV
jgi:hypothetical protein